MRVRVKRAGILFFAAVFLFFIAVGVFIGVFQWKGRKIATAELGQEYFFLVRDCDTLTAGVVAGDSYLAGGAGYLLEKENAVVLACYYKKTDAEFVEGAMSAKGVEVRVLSREAEDLTLNGKKAAEKSRVEANASTVDEISHILYDTANGLERSSVTQEAARAALSGVVKSLSGLATDNGEGVYALWNVELRRAMRRGRELASGILYSKDLRYLQIELCFAVLNMKEYFS